MPPWLEAALVHLFGDLLIGVGGEWASAVWREGGLDRGFNRPQDLRSGTDRRPLAFAETGAGRWVQALSALPFAALYIAHRMFPQAMGPALARLGWGAVAATASGLGREGLAQSLAWESDPVWLDGSDGERREQMRAGLRQLRNPLSAVREGAPALWHGLFQATGRPDAAASVRALLRTGSALFARAGSLLAATMGRQHDPVWASAADAWLGLSWGLLSTWPARGTGWLSTELARSLAAASAKQPRPAPTGAVLAIAPAAAPAATPAPADRVLTPGGR